MRDLRRLFSARSMAVVGGGAWCEAVIRVARALGFQGAVYPVHPSGRDIAGIAAMPRIEDLPEPVDVAFIGINRNATVGAVAALRAAGAGGAVCFASGFTEAGAEDEGAVALQEQLVAEAGDMPILGPNCYGFVNALDQVAIWPDQHGMVPVDRGVAILTQSSNIAINLSMQRRGLPIGYMVACGNMAQLSQAEIAFGLLEDDRVTAIGVHIEGFGDLRGWETLATRAREKGVPIVALKVGASEQAQQATVSHTASLAGSDAGAKAFLRRLGIAAAGDLESFLEALKLLHCCGSLEGTDIASISCSGGEASLIADMALAHDLRFPPLEAQQATGLRAALGPMVALANPLDYHTYVWRDTDAMALAWGAMALGPQAMTLSIVDYPHTDATDWECATEAALRVREQTGRPFAVVASLPELMPQDVAERLMAGGVVPMHGLSAALAAIELAGQIGPVKGGPVALGAATGEPVLVDEATAKDALASHGVPVPGRDGDGPFVVKALGLAHKTEAGAVRLNVSDVAAAQAEMGGARFLVEEMVQGGIAELLVGIVRDPAHGFVLTLGAGGVLTEILSDTTNLLLPVTAQDIDSAFSKLRYAPVLDGYRGKPAVARDAAIQAILAVQDYVLANTDTVTEVEINPMICTPTRAVAADALIRKVPS